MLNNTLPNKNELECPIGHKCEKCLLYRSMPVDVTDPTTGQVIRQGTEWDCVFSWIMLGSWDAGRQSQGVHAAVSQQTNETIKRQDAFLSMAKMANIAQGTPWLIGSTVDDGK